MLTAFLFFSAATCDIPPHGDFKLAPNITAELGGTIEYGKSFSMNSCEQGASDPLTGTRPTYRIPMAVRDLFPITVLCVYDPVNSQYILDRGNALDCAAYGKCKLTALREITGNVFYNQFYSCLVLSTTSVHVF